MSIIMIEIFIEIFIEISSHAATGEEIYMIVDSLSYMAVFGEIQLYFLFYL